MAGFIDWLWFYQKDKPNIIQNLWSLEKWLCGSYVYPLSYSNTSLSYVSYIGLGRCNNAPFLLGTSFFSGLSIPFFNSTSQSIFEKNPCYFISSQLGLSAGSFLRHLQMISYESSSKSCEKTGLFWSILFMIPSQFLFLSVKGGLPLIISNMNIPNAQISHFIPYPGWFGTLFALITSGAMYSGVPLRVFVNSSSLVNYLAKPKSVIFRWPSSKTMMFSGFKSL